MAIKLISNDTQEGLVKAIKTFLPEKFTKAEGTVLHNYLTGFGQALTRIVNMINKIYTDTFVECAEGDVLDLRIEELTGIKRKDGETDEDYRNRYYKILLEYKNTPASLSQMIEDFSGSQPASIVDYSSTNCFWDTEGAGGFSVGEEPCFWDDDNPDFAGYWTDLANTDGYAFTTIITLVARPSDEILNCILDVIEYKRTYGTQIYLAFPPEANCIYDDVTTLYDDPLTVYDCGEIPVVNGILFEFGTASFTDTSGNNNNGVLSGGAFGSSTTQIEYEMIGENFDDSSTNNNDGVLS